MKRGVKTEDEFISTMEKIARFVVRHRELSMFVGVAIIIGVILLLTVLPKGEEVKPEAELLYTESVGLMSIGRFEDAENILREVIQKFPNTRPGKVSYYYLGVMSYYNGAFDEALTHFDKFLSIVKDDYLLTPSALYGAGCSAEGLKDYERALSYFERITKDKDSPFYHMAMLAYGRVSGILGDTEKAQEILEELVAQNPPPNILIDARFYIGYFNR
jgi:tetratricopeptide (TPR) repeat protein